MIISNHADNLKETNIFKEQFNMNSDLIKLQQYLKQKVQNPFSKVQIIASTFNIFPKGYIINSKDNNCSINCFLCDKNYQINSDNKKQGKTIITYQLLWHFREGHLEVIMLNFKKKIFKSLVRQLSYEELISKIKKQCL